MSASPKAEPLREQTGATPAPAYVSTLEAPAAHKWIIALSVMLGTILEILDVSIVNVALPHMQGSFSASVDEMTWVATSYLVANGIMIPMTGWISARFGRKRYFLLSVTGFVLASACCGAARTLNQMVFFRLLQGFSGAAMQPSSQAILMETFPPEEQAMAMAFWGIGMMVAPMMGPTARRLDHRQLVVALELLHQRADRHRRHHHGLHLPARPTISAQAARQGRTRRLPRHRADRAQPGPAANRTRTAASAPTGSTPPGLLTPPSGRCSPWSFWCGASSPSPSRSWTCGS